MTIITVKSTLVKPEAEKHLGQHEMKEYRILLIKGL